MRYDEIEYENGHRTAAIVVKILEQGYLDPIIIQFLGSRTGFSNAINNSKGPRKAAMRILGRKKNEIAFNTFLNRIVNPPAEEVEAKALPETIEKLTTKFRKMVPRKEDIEPDYYNQFWASMRSREQAELDNE
jgi:hypothetical protein